MGELSARRHRHRHRRRRVNIVVWPRKPYSENCLDSHYIHGYDVFCVQEHVPKTVWAQNHSKELGSIYGISPESIVLIEGPYIWTFSKNILTDGPYIRTFSVDIGSVRPIYGLFIRKYRPYDRNTILSGRSRAENFKIPNVDEKSRILELYNFR